MRRILHDSVYLGVGAVLVGILVCLPCLALASPPYDDFVEKVAALEARHGGRLGVALLRTKDGTFYSHRGDELFAMCSVFKVVAVAQLLKQSEKDPAVLQMRLPVTEEEIQPFSFAIRKYLATGITLEQVAKVCLLVSDNTAANKLLRFLGGPEGVTAFARSIGDTRYRVDRYEMSMNDAVPGDERDTTTPLAMMRTLEKLLLGDALAPPQRATLKSWMVDCLTGMERIKAGTPRSWTVAHKTGTGDYGVTNAVGVLWPPVGYPLVLVVFYGRDDNKDADANTEIIAEVARLATQPGKN